MKLQYRISSLLAVITLVAICLFLWLRFVSPNVAGVTVSRDGFEVQLTSEFAERLSSNDDDTTIIHHVYFGFPIYLPFTVIAICLGGIAATYFFIRRTMQRRRSRPLSGD